MKTRDPRAAHRLALTAAIAAPDLAAVPQALRAQLVVENPRGRWTAGEAVELVLRDQEIRRGVRIEQVLFDGQPIPFEEIEQEPRQGEMRLRLRLPARGKPGVGHQISVPCGRQPRPRPVSGRGMTTFSRSLRWSG